MAEQTDFIGGIEAPPNPCETPSPVVGGASGERFMPGTSYTWQSPLQEAIHEHNPDEMRAKIRQAEVAIIGRIMAVSYRLDYLEEEALCEALARIRLLKGQARRAPK
jgi:hypothetical protein